MIDYYKKSIEIKSFILNKILSSQKKVQIWLNLKNGVERKILDPKNIYHLLSSF